MTTSAAANKMDTAMLSYVSAPFRWLLIGMVRVYQKVLSPLLGPHCRFSPTCSDYFIQAIKKRGLFVGFALGTWRILRCNPLFPGGYDPVDPEDPPGDGSPATVQAPGARPERPQ